MLVRRSRNPLKGRAVFVVKLGLVGGAALFTRSWGVTLAAAAMAAEYRGTSLIRKRTTLGSYRRPMPRVLRGS